jgi:hypothetical protein
MGCVLFVERRPRLNALAGRMPDLNRRRTAGERREQQLVFVGYFTIHQ